MTQREFFTEVMNSNVSDELKAYAEEAISKLDARNAKRSATPSKKSIENAPMVKAVGEFLTSEPTLASTIAEHFGISPQKAGTLAKAVEGVQIRKVKVKGKGEQNGYYL